MLELSPPRRLDCPSGYVFGRGEGAESRKRRDGQKDGREIPARAEKPDSPRRERPVALRHLHHPSPRPTPSEFRPRPAAPSCGCYLRPGRGAFDGGDEAVPPRRGRLDEAREGMARGQEPEAGQGEPRLSRDERQGGEAVLRPG